MTSTTFVSSQSQQDLRAPLLAQLSKRISGRWWQLIVLFCLDASVLYVVWQVTIAYSNSLHLLWYRQYNSLSLWSIIAFQVSFMAARGMYQTETKRCELVGIIKTLTFSHLLLLLIAFFSQTGNFVSQQVFILSWLLSVSFTCIARFSMDAVMKSLHHIGVVRHPIYLICRPEDRVKPPAYLKKLFQFNWMGRCQCSSKQKQLG